MNDVAIYALWLNSHDIENENECGLYEMSIFCNVTLSSQKKLKLDRFWSGEVEAREGGRILD